MSKVILPSIPEPTHDVRSIHAATMALKEAVEVMSGQRRGSQPPVTWDDLIRLGLATEADIPR